VSVTSHMRRFGRCVSAHFVENSHPPAALVDTHLRGWRCNVDCSISWVDPELARVWQLLPGGWLYRWRQAYDDELFTLDKEG